MNHPAAGNSGTDIQKLLGDLTLAEKQKLWKLLSSSHGRDTRHHSGRQVLVAFVKSGIRVLDGVAAENTAKQRQSCELKLKDWLADKLPGYAIPAKIYPVETIPRLASGKIDKATLINLAQMLLAQEHGPDPSEKSGQISNHGFNDSRSDSEIEIYQVLKKTWEKVLGCTVTSPGDHFFELGGDSILSIHVVSSLLKRGYRIGPNDLFNFPQIGELAIKLASNCAPEEPEKNRPAVNHVALTPIQSWFFKTITAHPGQWNQSRIYALPETVEDRMLQQALDNLAEKHDVFRIKFSCDAGNCQQQLSDSPDVRLQIVEFDKKTLPVEELKSTAGRYQAPFNLEQAPLFRFVLLKTEMDRLLLVSAHHLVMDIISWQILKRDLEYFIQPDDSGGRSATTTPFTAWADHLADLGDHPVIRNQIGYWEASGNQASTFFPFAHSQQSLDSFTSTESAVRTLETTFDPQLSQLLKSDVHHSYQTTMTDLLLSAFSLAVHHQFKRSQITVDVEGHGRFDPLEQFDLSATIGWFSTIYPLLLTSKPGTVNEDELISQTIKTIKEGLRQVSHGGVAFGILKHANQLKNNDSMPQPRILFNYLGSADRTEPDSSSGFELSEIDIDIPCQRHPANQRAHFIEILAYFKDRQFHIQWHYDKSLLNQIELIEFVRCYERTLQKIISHCHHQQYGGYTPSDFPDSDLDQQELDEFLDSLS